MYGYVPASSRFYVCAKYLVFNKNVRPSFTVVFIELSVVLKHKYCSNRAISAFSLMRNKKELNKGKERKLVL